MRRAASITSVPCGTCISRSLIFSLTSFCSGMDSCRASPLPCSNQRIGGFEGTASLQMLFKLIAPFLHDADGRHRRCVAQRTERAAQHVFRQVGNHVDVFPAPEPRMDPAFATES